MLECFVTAGSDMLNAMGNGLFDVGKLQGIMGAALWCVFALCGVLCFSLISSQL